MPEDKAITDKFGNEISDGDTVEFVFGGDHFEAEIFDAAEVNGVTHLYLPITVLVPAGSVALTEKDEKSTPKPTDTTKKGSK